MIQPTKHPKSGVYRLRMASPAALRDITARRYGRRSEFIENLKTKDPAEAKRLTPPVVEKFQDWLAAAQAEFHNRPENLTDRQIAALGGRYVAIRAQQDRDHTPPTFSNWETEISYLCDAEASLNGSEEHDVSFSDARSCVAEGLEAVLAEAGLHIDDDSLRRLVACLVPLERRHLQDLAERTLSGRWRETLSPSDFPVLVKPTAKAAQVIAGTSLDTLLERWALDHGHTMNAKPIHRALYDRVRTTERLATFLGHRDASKVTKADAVTWKDSMQRRNVHASTVRNDLSEMSAIWKCGLANGIIGEHGNPFAGISPPKAKQKKQDKRAFTDTEAAAIIAAAEKETGSLRLLPSVLCLTGARLNEICQATKEDIQVIDGVPTIRIHDEGEGRSVKNADSRRTVPIHPALVAAGFLEHVASLPARSSLWPDIKPDQLFGRRSTTAGRHVSRWLRKLGITDSAISPNHSWRHWFTGACRRVVMPQEVRSAITGHSARLDESASYGDGMATLVQVLAEHLVKVQPPWERVAKS